MKDTIITSKQKKTEIITWLICFLIANLVNLYAIITHRESSFTELYTSIGYVFILSIILYISWIIIRIIFFGIKKISNTLK